MKRLLTQTLGPYSEVVPTTTDGWIAPAGNRLWTPQQDIIIRGVDMVGDIRGYFSTLVAAGTDTALFKQQLSQASGVDVPGALCQLDVGLGTSLQGALTNSGPTFPICANKFVPMPDDAGQLILENTDIGVWVYRYNNVGNDATFEGMIIIHYILKSGGNI